MPEGVFVIDYNRLRDEILANPACTTHIQTGNDSAIADILNAVTTTVNTWVVTPGALARWAAMTGARAKIEEACLSTTHPCASVCLTIRDILRGLSIGDGIDLREEYVNQMLGFMQQAGILTAAMVAALREVPKRPGSIAESLFGAGTVVTFLDVAKALRG